MGSSKAKLDLEDIYSSIYTIFRTIPEWLKPYIRRFIRFIALPYCYFFLINWDECKISKFQVVNDFLYIFFVLKYYPYNYSLCRLWEKNRADWKYYYGSNYEPYQRSMLYKEVQKREYNVIFDDKEVCYQICNSIGAPLPIQYDCLDPTDNFRARITEIFHKFPDNKLIVKPVLGSGGKDIVIVHKSDDRIFVKKDHKSIPLEDYCLKSRSVIQKYMQSHDSLAAFSKAFSTIRIVTLLTKDSSVLIVGAFMRFGLKDAYVDNLSSGGIAVGVDIEGGRLMEVAYDFNSKVYRCHPDSGIIFSDFIIPHWSEIVDLARHVQSSIKYFRLLGLDIGVTNDGPVLIEINPSHDNIALEQSYGPILKRPEILKEYKRYGLIVNERLFHKL